MPRIDDYLAAKKMAIEALSQEPFERIAGCSGFEAADENIFRIPFLDQIYRVGFPDFEFKDEAEKLPEIPIQEQVLILHYMMGKIPVRVTGEWIAYREIPGASFYFAAFVKRAIDPLKKVFGQDVSSLVKAAKQLNGKPIETGDAGFEFFVFPKTPIRIILWQGDDEFPSEANILFDKSVGDILSPEDAAWLAGMLVYRLISNKAKGSNGAEPP